MMMKLIKRILCLIAVLLCSATAGAQYRWGPVAGFNFSEFSMNQKLVPTSGAAGFSAGVMGEIMFPGIGFGADAAILYNMHGGRINLGTRPVWQLTGVGNEMVTVHSLQIPINVKFKYSNLAGLERTIAPFVYGGPIVSFTLAHSTAAKAFTYPAGSVQLHFGIGAELLEHIQVSAGYYWGMTYEIQTIKLDNFSGKPRGWHVKLAYLF